MLAIFPPGGAREDCTIIRALSAVLNRPLPYDTLAEVRRRLVEVNDVFAHRDELLHNPWGPFGRAGAFEAAPFVPTVANFYTNDPISRETETMASCVAELRTWELKGTHGRVLGRIADRKRNRLDSHHEDTTRIPLTY